MNTVIERHNESGTRRKLLFCLFVATLFAARLAAQEMRETLELKKVKKERVPVNVIESFKKDFPKQEVTEYFVFPAKLYEYDWIVREQADDYFKDHRPDYYSMTMKGDKIHLQAVYDSTGKLVRSREIVKDTELPNAIGKALASGEYKNWTIATDKEVIKNSDTGTAHYKVKVEQGRRKELLYFDANGTILHRKKAV
jgi:hypothetical protein